MTHSRSQVWRAAADLEERGQPFVVVTVTAGRGSTPQEVGAKALVTREGLVAGTVGGGKVEARALAHAQALLAEGRAIPESVTWNLRRDIGMTCGGEMSFLFEPVGLLPWEIVVFGAGHVAQALIRILLTLDCRIHCVDRRGEWLERLPNAPSLHKHLMAEPRDFVERMGPRAFAVLMTEGHATDVPILEAILTRSDLPYVGVIGSRSKRATMQRELTERGLSESAADRFVCPIGLPIGRDCPEEIAISIAAQLIARRDGGAQLN